MVYIKSLTVPRTKNKEKKRLHGDETSLVHYDVCHMPITSSREFSYILFALEARVIIVVLNPLTCKTCVIGCSQVTQMCELRVIIKSFFFSFVCVLLELTILLLDPCNIMPRVCAPAFVGQH